MCMCHALLICIFSNLPIKNEKKNCESPTFVNRLTNREENYSMDFEIHEYLLFLLVLKGKEILFYIAHFGHFILHVYLSHPSA